MNFNANLNIKSKNGENINILKGKLQFRAGDRIRIVGESGSGKTTLIKALQGYIEGINGASSYTDNYIYMDQRMREFTPFTKTTLRQLFYDETDDALIIRCLEITNCLQYFNTNLKSLDVCIGSEISGGQKSRVCLAITLYRLFKNNGKILIVDEPDAGLDTKIAKSVLENIFNNPLLKNITIFAIIHLCDCQLSNIRLTRTWEIENKTLKTIKHHN